MLNFIEGHSAFGGYINYIDPDITGLLNKLQAKGVLEDTTVMVISDHGQHLSNYE